MIKFSKIWIYERFWYNGVLCQKITDLQAQNCKAGRYIPIMPSESVKQISFSDLPI